MLSREHLISDNRLKTASSVKDDVWRGEDGPGSYSWWYFDALSDDARQAVVISFYDNFVFSSRYNQITSKQTRGTNVHSAIRVPAVSFTYFCDGKPVYRSLNEYAESTLTASEKAPDVEIAGSGFRFDAVSYGSGFEVRIDCEMPGERRIRGRFEWLSIESDLSANDVEKTHDNGHVWNMVAPRSDVTGHLDVFDKHGRAIDVRHFRGTGYHDLRSDSRPFTTTVRGLAWGRAHFADSTAIYCRYAEAHDSVSETRLGIVRNGELFELEPVYQEQEFARSSIGIRYPTRIRLTSDEGIRLRIKQLKVLESWFYMLRFLSEITLTLRDGKPRKTTGITQFTAPQALKYRLISWLTDLRTGRDGRPARF